MMNLNIQIIVDTAFLKEFGLSFESFFLNSKRHSHLAITSHRTTKSASVDVAKIPSISDWKLSFLSSLFFPIAFFIADKN